LFEEMGSRLEKTEEIPLIEELKRLLAATQQTSLHHHLERSRLDKREVS
jgi:hypothetical protein